jgi:hypothetical protein
MAKATVDRPTDQAKPKKAFPSRSDGVRVHPGIPFGFLRCTSVPEPSPLSLLSVGFMFLMAARFIAYLGSDPGQVETKPAIRR